MSEGVEFVRALDITDEERELVTNGNARRLFKLP
jgi:predicted TIM-barrel fold metal-dependent hydrolase